MGWRWGVGAVLGYIGLGALGLPMFASSDPWAFRTPVDAWNASIAGVTGGYIIGFVVAAAVTGYLSQIGFTHSGSLWPVVLGGLVLYIPARCGSPSWTSDGRRKASCSSTGCTSTCPATSSRCSELHSSLPGYGNTESASKDCLGKSRSVGSTDGRAWASTELWPLPGSSKRLPHLSQNVAFTVRLAESFEAILRATVARRLPPASPQLLL